jgi:acyl-CoA dehydrogenase
MTESVANDDPVQLTLGETYPEIRELVRRICSDFPGSYWRALEEKQAYPTEFVAALTKAGVTNQLLTIPGGRHGNFTPEERTKIFSTIREFLAKSGLGAVQ